MFPYFFLRSLIELIIHNFCYTCLFTFCNIAKTGEPMHTTSKERIAPDLMFLSECIPQLSITDWTVKWPPALLSAMFSLLCCTTNESSRRSTSAVNMKIQTIHMPQLSAGLKVKWPLCFAFTYFQPITHHYSIRSTSAIQSPQKIWMILTNGKPCIALLQIDTLGYQQKEMRHKGKSMMYAFYVPQYTKRHITVQCDIEQ